MYNSDRLDLDSVIFKALRDEIMVSINAALMLADKEGKEGEVTVKIKVSTETVRKYDKGVVCKEWTEPRFSWNVARKMKENKIDHKGSSVAGWELRFDEDGRPYVVEANQQASLFEDEKDTKTVIHYHFGDKKTAETEENTVMPPYAKEGPEVIEDANTDTEADTDTTLDDDSGGVGSSAAEQPDNVPEADDAEGAE